MMNQGLPEDGGAHGSRGDPIAEDSRVNGGGGARSLAGHQGEEL